MTVPDELHIRLLLAEDAPLFAESYARILGSLEGNVVRSAHAV